LSGEQAHAAELIFVNQLQEVDHFTPVIQEKETIPTHGTGFSG
jgi:hypothetical protein